MSAGAGVAVEIVSGGGCRVRGTIAVWVASSKARPESTIKMRVDPLDNYWTRWVGGRQSTPHKEPSRLVEGSDGWKMRKRAEGFSGCFIEFFALSRAHSFVSSFTCRNFTCIYFSSLANHAGRLSFTWWHHRRSRWKFGHQHVSIVPTLGAKWPAPARKRQGEPAPFTASVCAGGPRFGAVHGRRQNMRPIGQVREGHRV